MTDHTTDEGDRIIALASLRLTEARARAGVSRMLLAQLHHHSRRVTTADAHDFAYAVWAEFRGDGGRHHETPPHLVAGVFAQVAPFLDETTTMRLARETWGDRDTELHDGADRIVWMPSDDLLIVTVAHQHADGSIGQLELLISPMRVTRSGS
ncbi:hypothetical protein [Microbacterium sp. IEGM 1404]|uniref:hypothetical protein n=1 Tax=Microbacterium sp. IEGM 1404 TaxID=3047084 RepID=UPI0024B74A45|nr:hypothetical protein [Microbacterium sp. IEGM 1404]MDI9889933.1 hypothetical protein [Microbacterium sp. IEGM 1404]